MKLIENNWWPSKQVDYKGNLLIVPVWTNWVATDPDGKILAFEEEPFIDGFGSGEEWWEVIEFFSELMVVGKAELESNEDWKESLIYVGENPNSVQHLSQYYTVASMGDEGYRNISLDKLVAVKLNGKTYKFEE